jgi:hypothetical protein
MANVSSGIFADSNLLNLKEMPFSQVRPEVAGFMVDGEQLVQCFKTVRDQVIFTNKRVFIQFPVTILLRFRRQTPVTE